MPITPSDARGSELQALVDDVYEKCATLNEGAVATYIPELAKADPDAFGVCVATAEGQVFEAGDCNRPFTIQSISKPFTFGMTDCRKEFPASWFAKARLCHERHDPRLNYFGVNASQSLGTWWRNGWIHPQDPRGWFQWYCRYYSGRRTADDVRQIRRWRAIVRHVKAITNNCEKGDLECRRRQRQAVLHWAYDSRKI